MQNLVHAIRAHDVAKSGEAPLYELNISLDEVGVRIELGNDRAAKRTSSRHIYIEMRSDGAMGAHLYPIGHDNPVTIWLEESGTATPTE